MNVTAINATVAGTYLTIWPTGAPLPDASSLNPVPGQPPKTLSVSSAAFSPTSSVFTYVKSGGQGGAYITSPADGQMVAPIDLPNGAIVSAAPVYFLDQNPISNLVVDLWCDDLITLGTFSRLAGLQTTGSTFGWRTGPMADLPQTINNDNCSYQLRASATANWGTFGNNLRIKAVKITYQLPG